MIRRSHLTTIAVIAGGALGGAAIASAANSGTNSGTSTNANAPSAPMQGQYGQAGGQYGQAGGQYGQAGGQYGQAGGQYGPPGGHRDPSKGGHRANGKTETLLTGETASKVRAAAHAKVPGGTIERVETDADTGSPYEAHVKKSDGSEVIVYVDANFNVTSTGTMGHP